MFNDLDRDNRRENEENKKSLLKDMAKKGISKKIKAMPLKTKLIIGGIILGIVLFLLIFIALVTPLMMLFFFDSSSNNSSSSDSNIAYVETNSEDNFWWPIGGELETKDGVEYATGMPKSTRVNSEYSGSRNIDGVVSSHSGMDIGVDLDKPDDTYYAIASMKGKVTVAYNGCDNNGYYQNPCGGTYGNHVVIEHSGGVYTVYAHLYPDSIRVKVGDTVNQGQVLGEMGNSGSSKGKHLHIGFEEGARGSQNSVDPRKYIDPDDPRPVTVPSTSSESASTDENYITMLRSWEGAIMSDDGKYLIYGDQGGVLTVGHGVTLINHPEKFKKRGLDINTLKNGDALDVSIVDEIELEIIAEMNSYIDNLLKNNGITLEKHQKEALLIRYYNTGTLVGFVDKYKQYGNSEELNDNYMSSPVTASNGVYLSGLARRRQAEFDLFNKGIYTYN